MKYLLFTNIPKMHIFFLTEEEEEEEDFA